MVDLCCPAEVQVEDVLYVCFHYGEANMRYFDGKVVKLIEKSKEWLRGKEGCLANVDEKLGLHETL